MYISYRVASSDLTTPPPPPRPSPWLGQVDLQQWGHINTKDSIKPKQLDKHSR